MTSESHHNNTTHDQSIKTHDEYKFFAQDTQTLADRRQSATQVYIGVNTSIFALIGFLLNDAGLNGLLHLASLPLFIVGILICVVWDRTVTNYKALIKWRYEQLREMEERIPGSNKIFSREWDTLFCTTHQRREFSFSNLERWLPMIILGLYAVYGLAFLIGKIIGF
jgi:hypothetical protein